MDALTEINFMLLNHSSKLSALKLDVSERYQTVPQGLSISEFVNALSALVYANANLDDVGRINVRNLDVTLLCYSASRDFLLGFPIEKRGTITLSGADYTQCAEESVEALIAEGWHFTVCPLSQLSRTGFISTLNLIKASP